MGTLNEGIDSLIRQTKVWKEAKSGVWGESTGYASIDEVTGGLHKGEVTLLGARTSHGKTALGVGGVAFNVAENVLIESVAKNEIAGQVLIFSPEMTVEQLLLRQASIISEVPSYLIRTGKANRTQQEAFHEALEYLRSMDKFVFIKATGSINVNDLVETVEHRNATLPVRLVVIDYLQRLTAGARYKSGYDVASYMSFTIKDMANREHVPVLLLSQLNRAVEKRKNSDDPEDSYPQLSDFRDSGRVEEDADNAWLLWRPNKMTDQVVSDDESQTALLHIAKQRNGPTGAMPLKYIPHLTLFRDTNARKVEIDGGRVGGAENETTDSAFESDTEDISEAAYAEAFGETYREG